MEVLDALLGGGLVLIGSVAGALTEAWWRKSDRDYERERLHVERRWKELDEVRANTVSASLLVSRHLPGDWDSVADLGDATAPAVAGLNDALEGLEHVALFHPAAEVRQAARSLAGALVALLSLHGFAERIATDFDTSVPESETRAWDSGLVVDAWEALGEFRRLASIDRA
jgi:hypothetical protein